MTAVIRTEKLTKSYGSHRGIVDVDLEVQKGEVFGFLGPNGAGKSTTIHCVTGIATITSGTVEVFGLNTYVSFGSPSTTTSYQFSPLKLSCTFAVTDVPTKRAEMTTEGAQNLGFAGSVKSILPM